MPFPFDYLGDVPVMAISNQPVITLRYLSCKRNDRTGAICADTAVPGKNNCTCGCLNEAPPGNPIIMNLIGQKYDLSMLGASARAGASATPCHIHVSPQGIVAGQPLLHGEVAVPVTIVLWRVSESCRAPQIASVAGL